MAHVSISIESPNSIQSLGIPFNLKIHAEARCGNEVWLGKTNASTRRKLQNRLNQRAHRRRKAEEKASKVQVFEIIPPTHSDPQPIVPLISAPCYSSGSTSKTDPTAQSVLLTASWCRRFEPFLIRQRGERVTHEDWLLDQVETETVSFEEGYLGHLKPVDLFRLPGDDRLLSLMYYNVFRGLTSNVRALSLDTVLMHTDSYPSPFIAGTAEISSIPPCLRPTYLQTTIPHHPCFDIFPDPVVRDNGIRESQLLPHGKLCMTLAGRNTWFENDRCRRNGLVIWGPPEEAASWEVTEGFVKHWGWLVKGSYMLERSTNRWRWARGEPAIFFA